MGFADDGGLADAYWTWWHNYGRTQPDEVASEEATLWQRLAAKAAPTLGPIRIMLLAEEMRLQFLTLSPEINAAVQPRLQESCLTPDRPSSTACTSLSPEVIFLLCNWPGLIPETLHPCSECACQIPSHA